MGQARTQPDAEDTKTFVFCPLWPQIQSNFALEMEGNGHGPDKTWVCSRALGRWFYPFGPKRTDPDDLGWCVGVGLSALPNQSNQILAFHPREGMGVERRDHGSACREERRHLTASPPLGQATRPRVSPGPDLHHHPPDRTRSDGLVGTSGRGPNLAMGKDDVASLTKTAALGSGVLRGSRSDERLDATITSTLLGRRRGERRGAARVAPVDDAGPFLV